MTLFDPHAVAGGTARRWAARGGALQVLLIALLLGGRDVFADGGVVRLRETSGPFSITVFSPQLLRVGAVDLSVLVQSAASGETVLDATVDLLLESAGSGSPLRVKATREAATNKLLQAAVVTLPEPGRWKLEVEVQRGEAVARVIGELNVDPSPPRLASLWPYLALPAVVVALFGLGQWLSRRTAKV